MNSRKIIVLFKHRVPKIIRLNKIKIKFINFLFSKKIKNKKFKKVKLQITKLIII